MAATTFLHLPRELRDMIWSEAALAQYNFLANSQPTSCISPPAEERLRQAFVGYDNLPQDTEKQPLRVYIHDSCNGDKLRLGVNEVQTLLNRLPIAAVCSEARSQAATFCQGLIGLVSLFYIADAPEDGASVVGDEISDPIFGHPTTVVIPNGERWRLNEDFSRGFSTAEHLVGVVNRVFGTCIERIIFTSWLHCTGSLEELYWPHTAQIRKLWWRRDIKTIFKGDQGHDRPAVFMTPERIIYRTDEHMDPRGFDVRYVAEHLTKFREIVDVSTQKLPRLQIIELDLHSWASDSKFATRIKATNKHGVLWVDWDDVEIGLHHKFVDKDEDEDEE